MEFLHVIKQENEHAYIQLPNELLTELSYGLIDEGQLDARQISFSYAYLVVSGFLYKYAGYFYNGTPTTENPTGIKAVQTSDIKGALGYNPFTKTVDHLIKKGGLLDRLGFTKPTREVPVHAYYEIPLDEQDKEEIGERKFIFINDTNLEDYGMETYLELVKKRYYEAKKPLFLTGDETNEGTLTNYENTFRITIDELILFLSKENLHLVDFFVYSFIKCKSFEGKITSYCIPAEVVQNEIAISPRTFYDVIQRLKALEVISYHRRDHANLENPSYLEPNVFDFNGITPLAKSV